MTQPFVRPRPLRIDLTAIRGQRETYFRGERR